MKDHAETRTRHQLLSVHNVHEGSNELAWDLAFLAFGVALIVGGWLLARDEETRQAERV